MLINDDLIREKLPNITLGANAAIGTAAATVDIVSHAGVIASAAGLTLTLPAPTDARSGRDFRVTNAGTNPFTIGSKLIGANDYADFSFDTGTWHAEAPTTASGSDFWRTDPTAQMPDGVTDPADSIVRSGQTKIDTAVAGDSGLTLDDLRSRRSTQLAAGDAGVTDTNMTAIGVDSIGKVRLANQISVPDIRATNPNPTDYAAGYSHVFKQSSSIGMTGIVNLPTYVDLITTRQYAQDVDFSGGPVRQDVDLNDGRQYFRISTGATTWGPWVLENQNRNLQERFLSQANTKISLANQIRWAGFYHIMTRGANTIEPAGYFRIDMPADGALIPVADGTTRAVVAATAASSVDTGGIPLNIWESLYYKHPRGQGAGSVPTNFMIVSYTTNTQALSVFSEADDWIRIATRDDTSTWTLGNGDVTTACGQIGRGAELTTANWQAMKQRAMGSGYFFSPGGNTATPTAFGFTGTIRWINAGSTSNVNSSGYLDVSNRTTGQAVKGVNGAADRVWRLMTAAEKPGWFGGMQRGSDPILSASTTVVDLNDNETLFLVPNLESVITTPQWVVSGYAGQVTVPSHWMPVASRQTTGGQSTIQVLIGGVQYALKAGDARYTSTNDATIDAVRRSQTVQFNGPAYCRFTTAGFFAGAAANGVLGSTDGVMLSWDANRMMYGISDGYASFGNQYTWLEVPAAGTAIPVVSTNSNITRVVQTIGGHRYIPLGAWEALFWVPPAYSGGTNSAGGDWIISYYGSGNQHVPPSAVLIAKMFSVSNGSGNNKTRVKFADGSYIQPGVSLATATFAEYDHAQGSGDWRAVTVAGSTAPAMTAALPAVVGIAGPYGAPYTPRFRYIPLQVEPRGNIELRGLIQLNANVVANSPNIAFIPGVQVEGSPIIMAQLTATALQDSKPIPVQLRFQNTTINGQTGVAIVAWASSFNAAVNPYFTLGLNGGTSPAGTPVWLSLDGIVLPHA